MKLFKKIFLHLIIFTIIGIITLIFSAFVNFNLGILNFIYYTIVYLIVALTYYYVNKKTKFLIKNRNKVILVITIITASTILIGVVSATTDYILAKNGKNPIFSYKVSGFTTYYDYFASDTNSKYSAIRCDSIEYYGLGYKLVVCNSCVKPLYFMPFGLGDYEWDLDKGVPIDKLNGKWYEAYNNDIYLDFDGTDNYALYEYNNKIIDGTYIFDEDKVILKPNNNNESLSCITKNNYYELHCDNYSDIFMK